MARLRNVSSPYKNGKVGHPKNVSIPVASEARRPENAPSLMSYYKVKGQLKETTTAEMYRARHLFITKALNSTEVAKQTKIPVQLIEQWVVLFDWQERRDKLLFQSYRKIHSLAKDKAQHIDARHDRIAGTMETLVERLLHDHMDPETEFSLDVKDIHGLARAMKELQGIRRIVHDKPTQRVEINKTITLDTAGSFENMKGMVESLLGARPEIEASPTPRLEVSYPGGEDEELEDALKD